MHLRAASALVAAVLVGSLVGSGATARTSDSGSSTATCGTGTVSWSPTRLRPPNHKFRDITITSNGAGVVTVTGVTHEEEGSEKGSTAANEPDFEITDATAGADTADTALVKLRGERLSKPKDGRTYTISVSCGDPLAGGGTAQLVVTVPHSRKR